MRNHGDHTALKKSQKKIHTNNTPHTTHEPTVISRKPQAAVSAYRQCLE
jgi:hypothetical protein